MRHWRIRLVILAAALALPGTAAGAAAIPPRPLPNVLLITVDTLRADRLSGYGYARPTTPSLDRLLERGARFTEARAVEPLTTPSLCSLLTSLDPHEHGATRNGLRLRPGLASLPKALQAHGYRTAAFVGNWTLRDKLSSLAEHFEVYEEIFSRRRWLGMLRREATAEDLNEAALSWLGAHLATGGGDPFLLWIHYVEPHAPYRFHPDCVRQLGIPPSADIGPGERYDTEVAFVDRAIGELLDGLRSRSPDADTLIAFASDHGESLGEHGYWGHGRNLYDVTLRVPMGIEWRGHVRAQTVAAPALTLDLSPTILGLLGLPVPTTFHGFDWSGVLRGGPPPAGRITRYQTHRSAVLTRHESDEARRSGLLEVALIDRNRKETFRVDEGRLRVYDLASDPTEKTCLVHERSFPSESLFGWVRAISHGLGPRGDASPELPLTADELERLHSLGYVE